MPAILPDPALGPPAAGAPAPGTAVDIRPEDSTAIRDRTTRAVGRSSRTAREAPHDVRSEETRWHG
jgi:hypothetical protein